MRPASLIVVAGFLAASPIAAEDADHGAAGGWMAETSDDTARVFASIENSGDVPITLVSFMSDEGPLTLMAPSLDGGAAVPLGPYPLAVGEHLEMEPDGPFLLLEDLASPMVKGTEFTINVSLEPAGEMTIHVDVEGPDAESQSHIGHDH